MKIIQIGLIYLNLMLIHLYGSELSNISIEDFSSEQSAYGRYAANIVNGSGLDGIYHSNVATDMWQADDLDLTPWVILDLGGISDLSAVYVWNYNGYDDFLSYTTWFGVKELELYITTDITLTPSTTWTLIDTFTLSKAPAPAASDYFFMDYMPLGSIEATYIKLLAKTNYITELGWSGTKWTQGNQSGLSEVKVYGARQNDYGYIEDVRIADYSNESLAWGFRSAENTINGSGFENGVHRMGWDISWQAISDDAPHYLVLDLGGLCVVDQMHVWNLNADPNYNWMASKGVDIYTSSDNVNFVFLKSVTLSYPEFSNDYDTPDEIDLGGIHTRYVKIVINSNYGTNPQYVGLDEVKFLGYRFSHSVCENMNYTDFDVSGPQAVADCFIDNYDWAYLIDSLEF